MIPADQKSAIRIVMKKYTAAAYPDQATGRMVPGIGDLRISVPANDIHIIEDRSHIVRGNTGKPDIVTVLR